VRLVNRAHLNTQSTVFCSVLMSSWYAADGQDACAGGGCSRFGEESERAGGRRMAKESSSRTVERKTEHRRLDASSEASRFRTLRRREETHIRGKEGKGAKAAEDMLVLFQ
jgi:hypothetical protein